MPITDYFALKNDDELAKELDKRIDDFDKHMEATGRVKLIAESYEQHYNLKMGNLITKSGGQGEIIKCSANLYRSYVNNIHVLVGQTKPFFKAEAKDGTTQAQGQCVLGDAVIEHYMQEGNVEAQLIEAILGAQLGGDVFMEVDWDETEGAEIAIDPETQQMVHSGALKTKMHAGLNVKRDINLRDGDDLKWAIVCAVENKWALAAQYPQHADFILETSVSKRKTFSDSIYSKVRPLSDKNSDLVEISRFYHAPLKGVLPQGKEALMINGRIIEAIPLTKYYRKRIPLARMAAGSMEGTMLPYSSAWDLLPLCQARQHLLNAAISNAMNLALTSVWAQSGSAEQLSISQLKGGFTLFESPSMPQALNLAHSSPEIWNTMNQIENLGQVISGLNSVARGDLAAASNLKSGTALATVLASAVQFQNMLQQRWKTFCEEAVNLIFDVLQKNATTPLLISISGSAGRSYQKAFTGKDLASVRKIRAEMQNPILSTQAGKLEMANNLTKQFPQQMDSSKYINVVKTGNLDGVQNSAFDANMVLLSEAEALRSGKRVKALLLERHDLHILDHIKLIATPDAKDDQELVDNVSDHIQQHLDQWEILKANPQWAALVGVPMLPDAMPPPGVGPNAQAPNGPMPSNPAMDAQAKVAQPSPLPANAGPGIQAAYEQSGVGQQAPKIAV